MSAKITIQEPKIILWSNYMDDFAKIPRISRIINSYSHADKANNEALDEVLNHLMAQEIDSKLSKMMSEFKEETPYAADDIVAIGILNLWNGQKLGYKCLDSSDIGTVFETAQGDFATWGLTANKDVVCVDRHHDGTNYYLYRSFKPHITDVQQENFLTKIYEGKLTQQDISRYTSRIGECFVSDKTLIDIYN